MSEPKQEADGSEGDEEPGERVPVTPGLIVFGIIAILLGVFSALVMSANAL